MLKRKRRENSKKERSATGKDEGTVSSRGSSREKSVAADNPHHQQSKNVSMDVSGDASLAEGDAIEVFFRGMWMDGSYVGVSEWGGLNVYYAYGAREMCRVSPKSVRRPTRARAITPLSSRRLSGSSSSSVGSSFYDRVAAVDADDVDAEDQALQEDSTKNTLTPSRSKGDSRRALDAEDIAELLRDDSTGSRHSSASAAVNADVVAATAVHIPSTGLQNSKAASSRDHQQVKREHKQVLATSTRSAGSSSSSSDGGTVMGDGTTGSDEEAETKKIIDETEKWAVESQLCIVM